MIGSASVGELVRFLGCQPGRLPEVVAGTEPVCLGEMGLGRKKSGINPHFLHTENREQHKAAGVALKWIAHRSRFIFCSRILIGQAAAMIGAGCFCMFQHVPCLNRRSHAHGKYKEKKQEGFIAQHEYAKIKTKISRYYFRVTMSQDRS